MIATHGRELHSILCDGCGLTASSEHTAARMERLELATRFRPIHINVLFVALEPMQRPEDDFYRPPESRDFFDSFLSALDITPETGNANLLEFQRRGYYLTYLSECPVTRKIPRVLAGCRGNRGRTKKPTTAQRANASRVSPPLSSNVFDLTTDPSTSRSSELRWRLD